MSWPEYVFHIGSCVSLVCQEKNPIVSPHCVDVLRTTQANPYVKHKLRLAAVSQLVFSQKTSKTSCRRTDVFYRSWIGLCIQQSCAILPLLKGINTYRDSSLCRSLHGSFCLHVSVHWLGHISIVLGIQANSILSFVWLAPLSSHAFFLVSLVLHLVV